MLQGIIRSLSEVMMGLAFTDWVFLVWRLSYYHYRLFSLTLVANDRVEPQADSEDMLELPREVLRRSQELADTFRRVADTFHYPPSVLECEVATDEFGFSL